MLNFCTLFDSYYLDKGLVLYNSLERSTNDFCLYIFCFDDKAYNVLEKINLKHAVLIRENDIETPELLKAKSNRTRAEYCWTCASVIIEYVLDNFDVDNCTYIDSDLYFYQDPKILFDELSQDEHVIIAPHRLTNSLRDRRIERRYGKYCVQFNYFDQSPEARKVLRWWIESCLEWCYCKVEDSKFGDQKYLDSFCEKFSGVHVLKNLGGGVAPWNVRQYSLVGMNENLPILREKLTGEEFSVVFYHFQSMRFLSDHVINIYSRTKDLQVKQAIYYPYLREILAARKELEKYDVHFSKSIIHASGLRAIYQKFVKPMLISLQDRTDIINLNNL